MSIEDVRQTARNIAARVNSDPEFRAQVQNDPTGVLTQAGLPADAVVDFMRETKLSEVDGYAACTYTCGGFTCWITI